MKFIARASTESDFNNWVASVKKSPLDLTLAEYTKLSAPSKNNPETMYRTSANDLYDTIVMKYMMPKTTTDEPDANDMSDMNMEHMDHSHMEMH